MAAPTIPQRPARSHQSQNVPTITGDIPKIPPRPKRSVERSVSPNRDSFARSPLNDPSFINGSGNPGKTLSPSDLPARPPSVTLPSIGQEGNEYANFDTPPVDENNPRQTRDAGGLKLYAPTAEMAPSATRSRIAAVTRTDSQQAAAAGFGRSSSEADAERPTRTSSAAGRASRPQSLHAGNDEEHGIPEIGLQVPMYPNAGDVQAPTPSPYGNAPVTGVGFFNNGQQSAGAHNRSKSGRDVFHGPPGSYGMHGHGVKPQDNFEKQWYAKHPRDAAREKQGEYGPAIQANRKDWALSSEDLNKLVQESASRGIGLGTSSVVVATPAEEIGYMASEEYASRMASPRPQSKGPHERKRSSATHAESPLRRAVFPSNVLDTEGKPSDNAIENDAEGDIIHIDPPAHERSRIHGGGPEAENLGPEGGNTDERGGYITEDGRGTPILASDELKRHRTPGAEHMKPAISPELERERFERERRLSQEGEHTRRQPSSRPTSRPTSGIGLSRWKSEDDRSGSPLDGVKEYEPLFPEDDEERNPEKPVTAADKLKRPDLARHHFPSQDVWEDTPSSLQLQTEVETPQVADQPGSGSNSLQSSQVFENPEAEAERKAHIEPEDKESFLSDHTKKFSKMHFNKDLLSDMPSRPAMQHRFPSQDIWEDTPDELRLVTEVNAPQTEDMESPVETKSAATDESPQVPARPHIPARPARAKPAEAQMDSPSDKKAPTLPERPKPQIPARPTRPVRKASDGEEPLSKTTSGGSTGSDEVSAPATKAKPPVPSRPGGGKIAALKAGFLTDLNSRLQLGPQAPKVKEPPKEEEPEQQKAPLVDARKGRARGPARRKPAASPSAAAAAAETSAEKAMQTLSIANTWTVFQIDNDGDLNVPTSDTEAKPAAAEASIATQVPAEPKPAPSDSPAEPELQPEPEIPQVGETDATRIPSESAENEEPAPTESHSSDAAVQTGQQDLEIQNTEGGTEKLTAYLGGRAPEEGSVIVKDGVEHVGSADGKHGIEQTGPGM